MSHKYIPADCICKPRKIKDKTIHARGCPMYHKPPKREKAALVVQKRQVVKGGG